MREELVSWALGLLGIYLLIGLVFAVLFAILGARRIDPAAAEGTWGFKVMIIPGSAVFWPALLRRWVRKEGRPEERSAHRRKAEG